MARLQREWTVTAELGDEEVKFTLREATNEEINGFLGSRYDIQAKGRKVKADDKSVKARCSFFDDLLTKIENLEDEDGDPVTLERKEKIPSKWKNAAILEKYEASDVEVDAKN